VRDLADQSGIALAQTEMRVIRWVCSVRKTESMRELMGLER